MNPAQHPLLEQLRDIHLPPAPGWWPPAPGWWLLAAACLGVLLWALSRTWLRWRALRPAREATRLFRQARLALAAETVTAESWLHQVNDLLKRLAVHGLGDTHIATAWDADWLRYLDARYGQPAFSRGIGRCLGEARFHPDPNLDPALVDHLISRFLARERRRFWRFGNPSANA